MVVKSHLRPEVGRTSIPRIPQGWGILGGEAHSSSFGKKISFKQFCLVFNEPPRGGGVAGAASPNPPTKPGSLRAAELLTTGGDGRPPGVSREEPAPLGQKGPRGTGLAQGRPGQLPQPGAPIQPARPSPPPPALPRQLRSKTPSALEPAGGARQRQSASLITKEAEVRKRNLWGGRAGAEKE